VLGLKLANSLSEFLGVVDLTQVPQVSRIACSLVCDYKLAVLIVEALTQDVGSDTTLLPPEDRHRILLTSLLKRCLVLEEGWYVSALRH
jgi:hypothetical protein